MQRILIPSLFLGLFLAFTSVQAAEEGFVSLFNGKDLTGWSPKGGDALYKVEDGTIVGTVNDPRRNTFLCSEKEYENFIFKVEFKFDQPFNSGIQFRSRARTDGERQRVYGYQCEIENHAGLTGCIYDEARRSRWLHATPDELKKSTLGAFKKDDWNELEIQCVGPSLRTWLNGTPVTDMMDTMTESGFFGLQVHSSKTPGQIRWRNIRIKELPSTPWIPLFKDGKFVDLEVKPAGKWEFTEATTVHATSTKDEKKDGLILSNQSYDNFAVRVGFKKVQGNSGLYFRAVELEADHWVRGFQCEIEGNHTAGGLWEVKGRGWVFQPTVEANGKAIKPTDWNDISTVAVGDRIVTNLNGTQVVDMVDPECIKAGKTALQLHGGHDMDYWFRNYEIMPLSKEAVEMIKR